MGREASSVTAQVDWVAPNRKVAAAYGQVDWVAPNRKIAALSMMVDYAIPLLIGSNLLSNPDAETGDITGWTSTQSVGGDGPFEVRIAANEPNPYNGAFYFAGGPSIGPTGSVKTLSQEIDLLANGFNTSTLDGSPLIEFGGWQASFSGNDTGQIRLEFLDGLGGLVVASHFGPAFAPIGWTEQRHVVRVPPGTRAVRFSFTATKVGGTDIDGYLDGAFVVLDSTTTLPLTTTLPPTTTLPLMPPTTTLPLTPPTTTLPLTTFPSLLTTAPSTTTGVPLQPHPADVNTNFGFTSAEVLLYANDFLNNTDTTFPGISIPNRSAWVLKAALLFLLTPGGTYVDIGTVEPVDSQQHPGRWVSVP